MSCLIKQPATILRPYVRQLVISWSEAEHVYQVLPDTGMVIGFQFSGRLSYIDNYKERPLYTSGITGILDSYRIFKNVANTGSVLVVFTETGASHFLNSPLHELFGQSLSLEHFFARGKIAEVQEKLEAAETDGHRIKVVERFLISQLKMRKDDQLVAGALYHINRSHGTIRIATITEVLHTSPSPLEKRFRAIVGASPKKYAGIVRARHMMKALNNNDNKMANYLSAYYDQAHFIKDFKQFTSLTPEQYLRAVREQQK